MAARDVDNAKLALEVRMGEIAALLDAMAEALVYYPEEIVIMDDAADDAASAATGQVRMKASAWPTIQEIDRVLSNWRALHSAKPGPGGRPRAA